jgi:hypothetical protein
VIFATDLDRTLIYSRGAIDSHGGQDSDVGVVEPVEEHDGAQVSFMTAAAAARFAALHEHGLVLPVTTRTPEQWRRITLPGPAPQYAITANGGVLLVDGRPDADWDAAVVAALARVAPLTEVWAHAARVCQPEWTATLRNAQGLFCYAVLHLRQLPDGVLAEAAAWARSKGWQLSLQGRKLYWVPESLTKSAAVAEVQRRVGAETVLAAGDSLLDADLLEAADRGIVARHGELVATGWTSAHVVVTQQRGIRAGAEIVDWFAGNT